MISDDSLEGKHTVQAIEGCAPGVLADGSGVVTCHDSNTTRLDQLRRGGART